MAMVSLLLGERTHLHCNGNVFIVVGGTYTPALQWQCFHRCWGNWGECTHLQYNGNVNVLLHSATFTPQFVVAVAFLSRTL